MTAKSSNSSNRFFVWPGNQVSAHSVFERKQDLRVVKPFKIWVGRISRVFDSLKNYAYTDCSIEMEHLKLQTIGKRMRAA
jgi:hypothetical protein